jgi:GT2 family glycosyltransferase
MVDNPIYKVNRGSANVSGQNLTPTPNEDVWDFGHENRKQKEEQAWVKSRPMNDKGTISYFDQQVDIIIPFHGQYEKVTRLTESIFQLTRSNYYTLTLVDDASPNENFIRVVAKNAKSFIKAFRCATPKGFAGAMKVGFERTESPYVCFINSDCVIQDIGWLRSLGEALIDMKKDGVRMVSPQTNNPVGGHEFQKAESKMDRGPNKIIPAGEHLSMYCFMCHRELFHRCGGFIKEYPYGYYEDEEFAARMNRYGFRQGVAGKSWVYHEGECTVKSICSKNPNIFKIMTEDNRDQCKIDMAKLSD